MAVNVRLFATLRQNRGKQVVFGWDAGLTVRQLLQWLEIPEQDVAILLVNGRDGSFETTLADNDVVSLFPPVGGG